MITDKDVGERYHDESEPIADIVTITNNVPFVEAYLNGSVIMKVLLDEPA